MTDRVPYTFKIADFTPETMPFGRLVEYYTELKRMIGRADHLHLIGIFESSHGSCLAIDREYESEVSERLTQINRGTAPKNAMRARDQINYMLREDGTSGEFSRIDGSNVIRFPGNKADENILYSIRDQAVVSGELYHIAGSRDDVKVRISTENFGVVYCRATREIGIQLREFLFEQVKITGRGVWKRTTDGLWSVNEVIITDFAAPGTGSLRQTVNKLRALDIDWPEDTLAAIDKIEERGGRLH